MFYVRANSNRTRVFVTEDKSIGEAHYASSTPFPTFDSAFTEAVKIQKHIDSLPEAIKWRTSARKRVETATRKYEKKPEVTHQEQQIAKTKALESERAKYKCKTCKRTTTEPVITLTVAGFTVFDNEPHCKACTNDLKQEVLNLRKQILLETQGGIQTELRF